MILITLSTLLSVVVVNLYFHGSRTQVPRLFKKVSRPGSGVCVRVCWGWGRGWGVGVGGLETLVLTDDQ